MPTGNTTLTARSKGRAKASVTYDEIGLARLSIGGIESELELSMTLRADQLYDLIAQANTVLGKLYEEGGIGISTLDDRHSSEIDAQAARLAHVPRARKSTPFVPGTPSADTPPHELRRLALLEVERIKLEKRRGDYK